MGYLFLCWFISLAKDVGFHFVLEKESRFIISNGFWDIIPDFCTDVRETFLRIPNVVWVSEGHLFHEFRSLRNEFS